MAAWVCGLVLLQTLVTLAPGDAIDTLPDPALRVVLAREWGLDQPVGLRILRGTVDALMGQWGTSWTVKPGASVAGLVWQGLGASAGLATSAWVTAVGAGYLLRGRRLALTSAVPSFVVLLLGISGINAVTWWGMSAGWWGRPSWFALPIEGGLLRDVVLVFALGIGSGVVGEVASALGDIEHTISERGFVIAARVRGQAAEVLARHRVLPVLHAARAALPAVLGGLVIVERLGGRPGLGDLLWRAVEGRDVPVATGCVIVLASLLALVSALVDVFSRAYDPRLRRT